GGFDVVDPLREQLQHPATVPCSWSASSTRLSRRCGRREAIEVLEMTAGSLRAVAALTHSVPTPARHVRSTWSCPRPCGEETRNSQGHPLLMHRLASVSSPFGNCDVSGWTGGGVSSHLGRLDDSWGSDEVRVDRGRGCSQPALFPTT